MVFTVQSSVWFIPGIVLGVVCDDDSGCDSGFDAVLLVRFLYGEGGQAGWGGVSWLVAEGSLGLGWGGIVTSVCVSFCVLGHSLCFWLVNSFVWFFSGVSGDVVEA